MRSSILLGLLLLTGCMVGPDYHKPEIAMPAKFLEAKSEDEGSDGDFCNWWKELHDPLLDTFLEEAIQGNYDFRIALEKILQARSQYTVERSKLWPEISFNGQAIRQRYSENLVLSQFMGPPVQEYFQAGFDTIWELDFFGKFQRGKRAAHDAWQASGFTAQDVMISMMSEVAKTYVFIRRDQQKIEIITKIIATLEEELLLTEALFKSGLDSEINVSTLLAQLESNRAFLPPLEISLKQSIYGLAVLLGKQPESIVDRFQEIKPIPNGVGKVPAGLPSDLLRRRPDIRSMERQLAAATEQIGVAVADLFPHISLTGSYFELQSSWQNKLLKWPSKAWSIGPTIVWDLINFGKIQGNIDIQKSIQRQTLLEYEKTVISALKDVEGALVAYFKDQEKRAFLEEEVAANSRTLLLQEDLYVAGLTNDISVLEARKALLNSQNTLLDSDSAVTTDFISLYKALGGSWECSSSP